MNLWRKEWLIKGKEYNYKYLLKGIKKYIF